MQNLAAEWTSDRVESSANPVDSLSRSKAKGPWRQVIRAKLPANLAELLAVDIVNSKRI